MQSQTDTALPKMAALLAEAALPQSAALPSVRYRSQGMALIIGSAESALPWADDLCSRLDVTVLLTSMHDAILPIERNYAVYSGGDVSIDGHLGAFEVRWRQDNPIESVERRGEYDLILDLSTVPLLQKHQAPYGYFKPGAELRCQARDAGKLMDMVGEFEKPKYFSYKEKICAHSRNSQIGCTACIDICSAEAVRPNGGHVQVDPYLCAGCGACTTVCPTGALSYMNPDVPYQGRRLDTLLKAYAHAGGTDAVLLFMGSVQGSDLINQLERLARSGKFYKDIPARVIPLALHHAASAGIDVWLAGIAYGAAQSVVLVTGEDAPQYRTALRKQAGIAQAILSGLGYADRYVRIIEANTPGELDAALQALSTAPPAPIEPARFHLFTEKRTTLDFVIDHLAREAPSTPQVIPLPEGAPFGTLAVDRSACTLCMACTGACPTSALLSASDQPRLRFIEKNCVQCGLCVNTCPEQAIRLVPRLALGHDRASAVVLNEADPFYCIGCGKPLGTVKAVESMLARLAGHSAFSDHPERLKMCGDCRVVDMMSKQHSRTIADPT